MTLYFLHGLLVVAGGDVSSWELEKTVFLQLVERVIATMMAVENLSFSLMALPNGLEGETRRVVACE